MNLSPINYQPMLISQNVKQQKSQNATQQNSTVNFKGYVAQNTKRYVRDFARKKFKGDPKAAREYVKKIMSQAEETAKKYPSDMYLDIRQYIYNGKVVGDLWVLGHKKLPSSQYELARNAFGWMDKRLNSISGYGYFSSYPQENIKSLLNKILWHGVIPNAQAGKGNAEVIEVMDQLAREIGYKDYYKEEIIPWLKKSFNLDAKENLSIGKIRRTEKSHIKSVYKDDVHWVNTRDGECWDHKNIEWGDEDKIKFVPGFVGWKQD